MMFYLSNRKLTDAGTQWEGWFWRSIWCYSILEGEL